MLHIQVIKKITTISITVFLLIFITWKFQIKDLLLFLHSNETWQIPSSSKVIAFSPNGRMIAVASGERVTHRISSNHSINGASSQVEIRFVDNSNIVKSFKFSSASSLAFSPDNSMIAAGSYGGEIKIWQIKDGKLIHSFKKTNHYYDQTDFLLFTPDRHYLISSVISSSYSTTKPSQLNVWNLVNGENIYTISQPFTCATASSDGQFIALGSNQEHITILRAKDGTVLRKINKKSGTCGNILFTADGNLLIYELSIVNDNGGVYIHRVDDGKLLKIISHRNPYENKELPTDIAVSPDGNYLAISYGVIEGNDSIMIGPSFDLPKGLFGQVRYWHIKSGLQINSHRVHWMDTRAIAFSPDGKWLASVSGGRENNRVRLWRMPPYSGWFWFLGRVGLVVFVYWKRNEILDWLNR